MTTTIQKWGNSQGIRIPKFILETLHWSGSEQLVVTAKDDKIIIEKAGHGIVEFPDYQGIPERYKLMIPRAALACTKRS